MLKLCHDMKSRSVILGATAVVLGAAAGLGIFTFQYAEGLSYLSNDPKACRNCHIMNEQYDSWQKGPHHAVATCNDCHVPHSFLRKYLAKAENGFHHSKGFTLQDFHEPIRITPADRAVVVENCVRCHAAMTHEIRLAARPVADDSRSASGGVDCIHCHARVAHGPTR